MRYVLILILLAGCGAEIDPTFQPMADAFQREAAARGVVVRGVSIAFAELPPTAMLAHCKNGAIEVDPDAWRGMTDAAREEMIFHELGHCALNRPHRDDVGPAIPFGFVPCSIMAANIPTHEAYAKYRAQYLDELFAAAGCELTAHTL